MFHCSCLHPLNSLQVHLLHLEVHLLHLKAHHHRVITNSPTTHLKEAKDLQDTKEDILEDKEDPEDILEVKVATLLWLWIVIVEVEETLPLE